MSLVDLVLNETKRYVKCHNFGGHDFAHVFRVYKLCKSIGEKEHAEMLVLETAALLHDLGREEEGKDANVDHATKSAEIAENLLLKINFPAEKITDICYAIRVHRFSKNIVPKSLEAKILQDADRIDISGALTFVPFIGRARCSVHVQERFYQTETIFS